MEHARAIQFFDRLISAQKSGTPLGIYAVCSANPAVLVAAMACARRSDAPVLIESTCNQVNQEGGYTGHTPAQFRGYLERLAGEADLEPDRILLGGDHLGPSAWQTLPAGEAMDRARRLVYDCVRAGYVKIHLDASMSLRGDPAGGLPLEIVAARTAGLCQAAEAAWQDLGGDSPRPRYVIGTEVPLPGGERETSSEVRVTGVGDAIQTLETTCRSFQTAGVGAAWENVIGLVVQPGVEFGNDRVHSYRNEQAADLSRWIETIPGIVFEAHSTDYQSLDALRQMVADHFAILKVGPALTFAYREAVFALEAIERELLSRKPGVELSRLQEVLEDAMLRTPGYWQPYYTGTPEETRQMRVLSLSDRIRYYWTDPQVQSALARLLSNLQAQPIQADAIRMCFPEEAEAGSDNLRPEDLIARHIQKEIHKYAEACCLTRG